MITVNGKYTTADIMIDDIDEATMSQIVLMSNHPAFTNPIKIMPDCHAGEGSCIGFTMPITDKIIPNVVSVDIGCGMLSMEFTKYELSDYDKVGFDKRIRELIPFGTNVNDERFDINRNFPYIEAQKQAFLVTEHLNKMLNMDAKALKYDYNYFLDMCKRIGLDVAYAEKSVGTLGSGNHFIELGRSENTGNIWITIHTGSRNLGKKVCNYWQKIAKGDGDKKKVLFDKGLKQLKEKYEGKELGKKIQELRKKLNKNIDVKTTGLEFLEGEDIYGYLYDMIFAQKYAELNRHKIASNILNILDDIPVYDYIETVHNYISFEDFIIRKGSIASYKNTQMIIPLNMEDGVLLCEGKSNPDWNYSAPHGAGRVLSRSKAKGCVNLDKAIKSMKDKGVFSTGIPIDEVKEAYKNSKDIEDAIGPTAVVIDKIIPIHNIKDVSDELPPWKKDRRINEYSNDVYNSRCSYIVNNINKQW